MIIKLLYYCRYLSHWAALIISMMPRHPFLSSLAASAFWLLKTGATSFGFAVTDLCRVKMT